MNTKLNLLVHLMFYITGSTYTCRILPHHQGIFSVSSVSAGSGDQVTGPGTSVLLREGSLCKSSAAQCSV